MYSGILAIFATLVIPAALFAQSIGGGPQQGTTGSFPILNGSGSNVEDAFQVNYASNLNLGDSVINITNAGTSINSMGVEAAGVNINGGPAGGDPGTICVNIYVFSPDEQLQACCSCPVTPNGLIAFAVVGPSPLYHGTNFPGLLNNTFFAGSGNAAAYLNQYNSAVIKLIASNPTTAGCQNTAFSTSGSTPTPASSTAGMITQADLVPGLVAWETHSHPTNTSTVAITENQFVAKGLSQTELQNNTAGSCQGLLARSSGRGLCMCPPGSGGNGLAVPKL